MYRKIRKSWRRFYRAHREVLDLIGEFLGAVGVFAIIIELYFILWFFS